MASPRYKKLCKSQQTSKSNMVISSLKKENAYLSKMLNELCCHRSELYKLLERFLSLEAVRLDNSQQVKDKNSTMVLLSEQLSNKGVKLADVVRRERVSSYFKETEEMKDKLVSITSRCQDLTNKVAEAKESTSDVQHSDINVTDLQKKFKDALEKNKQWLDYDQQREAYVRAILARMLWLEKQLNEANQARSQQHNENHSDERKKIGKVKQYYEGLLQRANDELDLLREQVCMTKQALTEAQKQCKEKQSEVKDLEQQLQIGLNSRKAKKPSDDKEQWWKDEAEDLQVRLNKEKRRSAALELQASFLQRFLLKHHEKAQENAGALERMIEISSQDLQDEKQNCSYLKTQLLKVLRKLHKDKKKEDCQDHRSCVAAHLPPRPSTNTLPPSPHSSLLDDSILECPGCGSEYPASHYRDLLHHLENCFN